MASEIEHLAIAIHQAPALFVAALSGGGVGGLAHLTRTAGASRTLLEAVVPYNEQAMIAWLGARPDQFCSDRTARAMAMAAYRRAGQLAPSGTLVGLGCTASLATDRPKMGPHRAHVALQTESYTSCRSLYLEKGARTRLEEEEVVDRLLLNAVAEACGLEQRLPMPLQGEEKIAVLRSEAPQAWRDLLAGRVEAVALGRQTPRNRLDHPRAIFPGEFNPLHVGHQRMAAIAQQVLRFPVEFEISVTNVDKPALDYCEIERRAKQFGEGQSLWLTRACRFTEKSRLFPGATFVVGIDTLRRIAASRYYANDSAACEAAIAAIANRGCRFLVFGRNLGTGFVSLNDLDLPDGLRALCREIPAAEFREDISSTALRRASGQ